jgi:adenylate cyclase
MSGKTPTSGDGSPGPGPLPSGGAQPPASSASPSHGHGPRIEFKFLEQLKRRNIVRVAILYVVVCYLILEPFGMFVHVLALPEWTGRTVVVLMALGFPAALIFAWIFEITPGGLKQTAEVDPRQSIGKQTGQRLNRAIVAVMAVALAYFVVDKFWLSKRVAEERPVAAAAPAALVSPPAMPAIADKSVAVLPFVDMSEKKDQEYFSDGLSEELIDMLTKIPDLRVPARTSSFYFKGKSEDIPTIARRLMVANVLEGSVRKSGKHLRITAQLVRADNGFHLWSETYDRQLDDIFRVQDEIAGAVVKALKASLLDGVAPQISGTRSADAYALYLQARYFRDRQSSSNAQRETDLLQQALRLDPSFGRAWAELSRRFSADAGHGLLPLQKGRDEALRAAKRAIELDPRLPEAHIAMSRISFYLDWDWTAAEAEMEKARELDAGNADALFWGGIVAGVFGRLEEALRLQRQAIVRDPLNPSFYYNVAETYLRLGRPAEAETAFRTVLGLDPAGPVLHWNIALALLLRGEQAAALAEMQRELPENDQSLGFAIIFHAMGRNVESDAAMVEAEKQAADGGAFFVASAYAYRREVDQALVWLERAYKQHEGYLATMKGFPLLKNLEPDPRYKAFLRKMKLPE